MKNFTKHYVFASDYSSSTGFCEYYHNNAVIHLEQFIKHTDTIAQENVHYLVWGNNCEQIPLEELFGIYYQMDGNGGSYPVAVFEWIKSNIEEDSSVELWLITDGGVETKDVHKCLKFNETIYYSQVKFIVISESDEVDLSLGFSFFTQTFVEVYKNFQLFTRVGTKVDFYLSTIDMDNFHARIDFLRDFLQVENVNRNERRCLEIADKLSHLKARLLFEVKMKKLKTTSKDQIIDNFERSDCSESVTQDEMENLSCVVDSKISTLINSLTNKKVYRFKDDLMNEKRNFDVEKRGDVGNGD